MNNYPTNRELWLNNYGMIVFQHKTKRKLFAERSYHWVNRLHFIDESEGMRKAAGEMKFSEFDISEWIQITPQEFEAVERFYCEVEQVRRNLKLKSIL